jgi:hypothetical protein
MTNKAAEEKARAKFGRWYDKNREDHNAKRRAKYKASEEVREKARANAKRTRERGPGIVSTKPIRVGGEYLYSPSAVAEKIGRSTETLRTWKRNGWVPQHTHGRGRPMYTMAQIRLLRKLARAVEKFRYDKEYEARIQSVAEQIAGEW